MIPHDDVVPLGAVGCLCSIGGTASALSGGKRECGNGTLPDIANVGFTPDIPYKYDFVY